MNISRKWISALAATAAVSLFSLSSNAAELAHEAGRSKTVKLWDLDLTKPEDVQTFNARVRAAANDVCSSEAHRFWKTTRRPAPMGWHESCVNDATQAALRDVGNRRLAMLFE